MSMTEGENYVTNCENDYKFKRILESWIAAFYHILH
jgi:hypothetical protein